MFQFRHSSQQLRSFRRNPGVLSYPLRFNSLAALPTAPSSSRTSALSFSTRSFSTRPLTLFSEEENLLRSTVAKFAQEHIKPIVREMDEKQKLSPDLLKQLFDQGLMGVEVPQKYGGTEMSFTQACIVIEELARVDPAISVIVDIQNTLLNTIMMKWATEAQKEKYLPKLATDTLGSFCLSEVSCGSDAFALETTARKEGKHWVLNGTKFWISNASEAGFYIVFATVDKAKRHRGITAFIVEKGAPGFKIGKKEDKLGIRASSTCEIIMTDVKVPEENILGQLGQGYKIAIEALNEGRIGIGAQMVGLAQGAFESAMPYIHQRKAFGQPIAHYQGMQFSFAHFATEIEAARLLVYNAARLKESGAPFVKQAAMAKLYASRMAEEVASKAIEWMGGVGFIKEFPLEKFFRDAKIGSIYEGTTNMQLQTIAKLISEEYDEPAKKK